MIPRFDIQPSTLKEGYWVVTDTVNDLVCVFAEHNFNKDQKFTFIGDDPRNASDFARISCEMGEWLLENHFDLIF